MAILSFRTIRARLAVQSVLLAALPLFTLGSVLFGINLLVQKEQNEDLQAEITGRVIGEVHDRLHFLGERIELVARTSNLMGLPADRQRDILSTLIFFDKPAEYYGHAIEKIVLLDRSGTELVFVSQREIRPGSSSLADHSSDPVFLEAAQGNRIAYGQVLFTDQYWDGGHLRMAVPLVDRRTDALLGVVMATVRMTRIWSPTLAAEFGERGSVFLCDESNRVIAHANSSLLLQPCGQGGEPGQGVVRGLDRKGVLRVNHPFSLSNTPLWCVADWPVSEAFAITWQNAAFTVVATVFCLSVGLFFGLAAVRRIVAPLENLAREVAQIRAGNLDTRMTEEGDEEVRQLAVTVNAMTRRLLVDIERRREAEARLIEAREKLEQRVNERTTELRESNAKLLLEIEERKTAEAELAASEAKFRELFNQAEDYILVMDVAAGRIGIILDANDAAFRMHGYERGEFLDRHISEIDASPRELYDEQFRRLFLGERVRFETLHRRRDGSIFPVEVVATLCTAGGRDYILSVERDITERKQAEDALLQATEKLEERVRERTSELLAANEALQGEIEQRTAMEKEREKIRVKAMTQGKLASLGEIATGVAHEINQPLTYLRIIFDSILRDMERDRLDLAELGEECRESLRQISRISVIIDHLRVFGRAKSMDRVEVRIDRVVRDSLVLMRERLRTRKILLDNRLDASLPAILGNAVKLEEVFLNLFQNAIDALEGRDNGVICIEASLEEEGKMLLIRFTDNGPGIPEEIREKIFEPFFTTKEVGKGTGLGLSIVFGIVKEHGGAIECESAPGEFTTFVITLPVGHPFGEEPDAD